MLFYDIYLVKLLFPPFISAINTEASHLGAHHTEYFIEKSVYLLFLISMMIVLFFKLFPLKSMLLLLETVSVGIGWKAQLYFFAMSQAGRFIIFTLCVLLTFCLEPSSALAIPKAIARELYKGDNLIRGFSFLIIYILFFIGSSSSFPTQYFQEQLVDHFNPLDTR